MSLKRGRATSNPDDEETTIFKSSEILDRSSRFLGFCSLSDTAKSLQALPEVSNASHRIVAWRRPSTQRSLSKEKVYELGHDDDGEKYGGKALESVLSTRRIEGTVMVARWWGGVLLGPVRFEHIKRCANDAISQWQEADEEQTKKLKLAAEEEDKEKIDQVLSERDQSIQTLRALLAEKTHATTSSPDPGNSQPFKAPDYAKMPIQTLRKLENVRDKTIAWLLAKIEEAENQDLQVKEPHQPQGSVQASQGNSDTGL